LIVILTNITRT